MPNLDGMPIRKYQPLWPYQYYYDNLPINDIEDQIFVVNAQTDINQASIEGAIGSAGNLANRLNQSLEDNGDLKSSAIDKALHSIAEHTDEDGYVRMTDDERAKLVLVDSEATNLSIEIEAISNTYVWPDVSNILTLANSDTIAWRLNSGRVYADTTFALSLITVNWYNIIPIDVSGSILFKTSSSNTPYKDGTLRVYINGLRLNTSETIDGFKYTETDPTIGTFTLNTALGVSDIIRIDFDQPIS